jgi:hypothetical protein
LVHQDIKDATKIYKTEYIGCVEIRFYTAFKNSLSRACFESRTVLAYVDLQIVTSV